jgi:hypothetical protein
MRLPAGGAQLGTVQLIIIALDQPSTCLQLPFWHVSGDAQLAEAHLQIGTDEAGPRPAQVGHHLVRLLLHPAVLVLQGSAQRCAARCATSGPEAGGKDDARAAKSSCRRWALQTSLGTRKHTSKTPTGRPSAAVLNSVARPVSCRPPARHSARSRNVPRRAAGVSPPSRTVSAGASAAAASFTTWTRNITLLTSTQSYGLDRTLYQMPRT